MEEDKKLKEMHEQVEQIMQSAKAKGLEGDFFYTTTLSRYVTQLELLEDLKKHIKEDGSMVTKEYVKGRQNLYVNPAVAAYSKAVQTANNTVVTLSKIVASFGTEEVKEEDPMVAFLKK